jgi:preprotein translocase subunit SecE
MNRPGSAQSIADKEKRVSDFAHDGEDREQPFEERREAAAEPRGGFFDIYKSGQGYHTRVGSGLAMGALVIWFAFFLYQKFSVVLTNPMTAKIWQFGIFTAVILSFGLFGYWLLARNRTVGDFLIATESEMKKVSWTSRKDIIGSTKVVVFVMCALGLLLFIVDMFFIFAFNALGVLKGAGLLETLKGMF